MHVCDNVIGPECYGAYCHLSHRKINKIEFNILSDQRINKVINQSVVCSWNGELLHSK